MSGCLSGIPMPPLNKSEIDRFWGKVDLFHGITDEDCWIWKAAKNQGGYGSFLRIFPDRKFLSKAHRISWALYNGEISKGLVVMHKCDNPSCVNPSHLLAATQKDNSRDCVIKGRMIRHGSNNGRAKLSNSDCSEIRASYKPNTKGAVKSLVARFGVHKSTIYSVVRKSTWSKI